MQNKLFRNSGDDVDYIKVLIISSLLSNWLLSPTSSAFRIFALPLGKK